MVQSLEKYPQGIDFQTDLLPSSSELSSDYYRRPVRGKRKVNKLSKCTQEKMVENEEKKKSCVLQLLNQTKISMFWKA